MKHFINVLDHDTDTLSRLLERCHTLKGRMGEGIHDRLLLGKVLLAYFEKPSTRTRFSLESAIASMGGYAICQDQPGGTRLGEREPIKDIARVVSRYVNIISIRTFAHSVVEELAEYGSIPVINALSDFSHPTQAMADIMTIEEHLGTAKEKHLVFVGDGNNVARSLAAVAGRLGMRFTLTCPEGYELDRHFREKLERECPNLDFTETHDPAAAVKTADIVYTDVWASMGQEEEAEERQRQFMPFQVNEKLMAGAPQGCIFMHCLPAHRGEESTDGVLESQQSVIFDQAENRMHFYRGLFVTLLGL